MALGFGLPPPPPPPPPPIAMSAQFQNSSGGVLLTPHVPILTLSPLGSPGGTHELPVSQYHCSTHRSQVTPAGSLNRILNAPPGGIWPSPPGG